MNQVIILESRGMVGGATESIRLLIENIGHPVDLIVPKYKNEHISRRKVKKHYGENVRDVYEFYLPYSLECSLGSENFDAESMKRDFRLFTRYKKDLYIFLESKQYTNIHLNGLGLYPVLDRKFPMTIHIRQIFNGNQFEKWRLLRYLRRSKGVVFIDYATKRPFENEFSNSIILENPVDQRKINTLSLSDILKEFRFEKEDVIFCIAGTIAEIKGQKFLIDVFNRLKAYPYKLLIAGDGKEEIKKECYEAAKGNPNIVFLGRLQRQDMLRVYKITDYVIRAEEIYALGRTVYEGIYSGCGLIIQGNEDNIKCSSELQKTDNDIFCYIPRNEESLLEVLNGLKDRKKVKKIGKSNAEKYAEKFNDFIEKNH